MSEEEPETLYEVLGVLPDVGDSELRQAYKREALRWHPDKNQEAGAEERFKKVNTAWQVLSNEAERAEYNLALARGEGAGVAAGHTPARQTGFDAAAAHAAWRAFLEAEERERREQRRRERSCLVGVISLAAWVVALLLVLWLAAERHALLFPPPLELTNAELARYPLALELDGFIERLVARHRARLPESTVSLARALGGEIWPSLVRTSTPYVLLRLNSTAEVRRAPSVGRRSGRGWLLRSESAGRDLYDRPVSLTSHTFLYAPEAKPAPWPATTLCARLLRSGGIKRKEWYEDLYRSVGGRLRPFALAVVPASECQPEAGALALAGTTALAVLASLLTVRLVA